jgi:hypothetical protein
MIDNAEHAARLERFVESTQSASISWRSINCANCETSGRNRRCPPRDLVAIGVNLVIVDLFEKCCIFLEPRQNF